MLVIERKTCLLYLFKIVFLASLKLNPASAWIQENKCFTNMISVQPRFHSEAWLHFKMAATWMFDQTT
jgi:hypothetical protein